MAVLKASATLFDENMMGKRSVNMADFEYPDDGLEDRGIDEEINEFLINAMRRRTPGASMNKETWDSLSDEGKATWDKLEESDKRKVLQYAMNRAKKESIDANVTEVQDEDTVEENDDEDGPGEVTEAEINKAITQAQARKDAHPGDARRLMSGKGKTRSKGQAQIKNVNFLVPKDEDEGYDVTELEHALERYWNPPSDLENEDF
jgi:hypothetical protein